MSLMISPTSTMTRESLTVQNRQVRSGPRGKISRVKSVIPSHQAGLRYHHNAIFQQSFNVPSNLFMNGGAKCTLRLQGSQYTRTKSFCLQFEVSHSSGCAYLPASHWFDRISIFTSGGSKHAQTITSSGIEAFYNVYQNRALDGVLNLAGVARPGASLPRPWALARTPSAFRSPRLWIRVSWTSIPRAMF